MKTNETLAQFSEFELIDHFRHRFPMTKEVVVGIGDDTAVLERDEKTYDLITTDFVIEGRHFTKRRVPPFYVGWKMMARSLSDIAAMGGTPRAAVVGLACPQTTKRSYLTEIERGMASAGKQFSCPIVGGDLSAHEQIVLSGTIIGTVAKKNLVTRSGAAAGDYLVCTGTLGGAGQGKHARFTPRLHEGQVLGASGCVSALCDISDGLVQDLTHLFTERVSGADLYAVQIPVSSAARRLSGKRETQLKHALYDGEDYELLFAVPPRKIDTLFRLWQKKRMKTRLTVIGMMTQYDGIILCHDDDKNVKLTVEGYRHF